ncbi:MAG: hypothetical protein JWO92_1733 [Chitinophagaceae bacterium]|nr:hypothetical protein [Chitinophagaceae bacterium]
MKKIYLSVLFLFTLLVAFCQNPLMLKDVFPGATGSGIQQIVKTSNYTFFNAEDADADADRGLYRTDGTAAGTIKLNLTYPTYNSTKADKLTALGDKIIFAGDNFPNYGEIWASDGTQAGTIALERFQPTNANTIPVVELAAMGSNVYYSVIDGSNHALLKKTNGTIAGTSIVFDFNTIFSSAPEVVFFKELNNVLYFIVYDAGGTGYDHLWRSDGTTAGTYELMNFGATQYVASNLMPAGNNLYVMIVTPGTGNVLWKTDGTVAGTVAVKTIGTTGNNNYPQNAAIGSTLYFSGLDGNGMELWKTDGTAAGTVMVADINSGAANSSPNTLTVLNNNIYFNATTPAWGSELWKFDGVNASLVKDINPGTAGSSPGLLVVSNNVIFFRALTATYGSELWISDGTTANTVQVSDINPGLGGSIPSLLTPGVPLYFSATNGVNGAEIFKYDNSQGIAGLHKIYVNDNSITGDIFTTAAGNNSNTGTKTAPVATINYAISIAQPGDTVMVDAGTFAEQVNINKGIVIRGAGQDKSFINRPGEALGNTVGAARIGLVNTIGGIGDVIIKNLSINVQSNASSNNSAVAVLLQTGGGIYNCEIKGDAPASGVYNGEGILVSYQGAGLRNVAIESNNIYNLSYYGINIQSTNMVAEVKNNVIDVAGSFYGMGILAGGEPDPLNGITITGNIVKSFTGFGIKVNSIAQGIVTNNYLQSSPSWQTVLCLQNNGAPITATCNWFNTTDAEVVAASIAGNVTYLPWLVSGVDTDPVTAGFQPVPGSCTGRQNKFYVNDNVQTGDVFTTAVGNNANNGFSSAPFATVDYAYGVAQAGDSIFVDAGIYNLGGLIYTFSKPMTFYGANYQVSPNDAANKLLANGTRNAESILTNGILTIASSNLSFKGFTFDLGDHRSIDMQISSIPNDLVNFLFEKNILKINTVGNFNQFLLTGKLVISPSLPLTSGFTFTDNRFEKSGSAGGTTFNFNYLKNVSVTGNSFVVTGTTVKTQQAFNLGNTGIVDNITFSNNFIDGGSIFVNTSRVSSAIVSANKIVNTDRALNVSSTMTESSSIEFSNNIMETTTGGGGFIGYSRSGTSLAGTSNLFKVENNTITGVAVAGLAGQLFGAMNFSVNNTVLNPSFIIRGNKITYSGDFSSITNDFVRPITVRGNVANVTIEKNEIVLNNAATMLQRPAGSTLPANPGITINTDLGSGSYMPSTTVINILNNKVQGFKQSVVFYDASNGINAYIGYGNIPAGATVNVNNNSFSGDSISINSGAVGQMINASCNWYGAIPALNVSPKVTETTVDHAPWLTNGTDTDPATGFQPLADVCNGVPVDADITAETNVTCNGAANGSINVLIEEGLAPFTYAWSKDDVAGFSTAKDLTNLAPGSYKLIVTDANGSVDTVFTNITGPQVLSASSAGTNNTCFGASTGTAEVTATGGTLPYTYLWNNGAATSSISNLAAGIYSVAVTDANGCTSSADITITEPEALLVTNDGLDISCHGANDGFISLSVSGGTGEYTFLWSSGETTSSLYNLSAGNYSVTVTDANGCIIEGTYTIQEPAALQAVAAGTNITTAGASDGTINLSITGGTEPYDILWDNGATTTQLSGLATGIYTANIMDFNGCTASASFEVKGQTLTITVTGTNVNCFNGSDGTATATPLTGTAPFTYVWSNGGITQTISGLPAGTYSVTVTDADNASATGEYIVSAPSTAVTASLSANPVLCFGGNTGSATVTASGGAGAYTYLWNNGSTSATPNNLIVGIYNVTVTDANGCTATNNIEVIQPAQLIATASGTNVLCNGGTDGSATTSATGGTAPYTYLWSNGVAAQNNPGLPTGTYTVTITDANGCTTTASYAVTQPSPVNATVTSNNVTCFGANNGNISITARGGTAPYVYSFNAAAYGSANSWTNMVPGTYTVAAKDAHNCLFSSTVTITQPQPLAVAVDATTNTCVGSNSGAISITVSGGTTKYSFSWTGPNGFTAVKEDLTGLAAGTYTLNIIDANGCTITKVVTIAELPAVSVIETVTPVTCFGTTTGSIALAVSAGTFTYSWAGPGGYKATTKDISNLKAGAYTVTITPAGGCIKTATYNVTQPASALAVTTAKTDISNCGGTGSITLTATGGTAPYQYSKGGGIYQSANSFTGLAAATYTIAVKDNKNCTVTATVVIVDNGSDPYEANEKQTAAKNITVNAAVISARIAPTATDKDWYQFTTGAAGTYTLTVTHPSVLYSYDVYDSRGRVIIPATTSGASKNYTLLANTLYSVQVRGALSYICYQMQVTSLLITSAARTTGTGENVVYNGKPINAEVQTVEKLNASVYPNPHNGIFNLLINSPENGVANIELFNGNGQKVITKNVPVKAGANIVNFTNVKQSLLLYRITIGKNYVTGKVIGPK